MSYRQVQYNVLFVSRHKVDPFTLSGTLHYSVLALRKIVERVDVLDSLRPPRKLSSFWSGGFDLSWRLITLYALRVLWRLRGNRYDMDRSVIASRYYAKRIRRHLAASPQYDFIVMDKAYVEIAFLKTTIPILYLHDAVYCDLIDLNYFPSHMAPMSVREARLLERRATARSVHCIYSSRWAAESAIRHVPLPPAKVSVAHTGPNFSTGSLPAEATFRHRDPGPRRHLLLVGTNWERKGCAIALETVRALEEMNIPTSLTICGCRPSAGEPLPDNVTLIPKLDKNIPEELNQLVSLYQRATFFILPTRAECLSMALIEALAFGLPVLGTDVGGNNEAIRDGQTGFLLPLAARGAEYAQCISKVWKDAGSYQEMSSHARQAYLGEFNWDRWGQHVRGVMEKVRLDRATTST